MWGGGPFSDFSPPSSRGTRRREARRRARRRTTGGGGGGGGGGGAGWRYFYNQSFRREEEDCLQEREAEEAPHQKRRRVTPGGRSGRREVADESSQTRREPPTTHLLHLPTHFLLTALNLLSLADRSAARGTCRRFRELEGVAWGQRRSLRVLSDLRLHFEGRLRTSSFMSLDLFAEELNGLLLLHPPAALRRLDFSRRGGREENPQMRLNKHSELVDRAEDAASLLRFPTLKRTLLTVDALRAAFVHVLAHAHGLGALTGKKPRQLHDLPRGGPTTRTM